MVLVLVLTEGPGRPAAPLLPSGPGGPWTERGGGIVDHFVNILTLFHLLLMSQDV